MCITRCLQIGEKQCVTLPDLTDYHVCLQLGKKECISLPGLIDFPSVACQPALSPGITDISLLQIESKYDDTISTDVSTDDSVR